ncbi:glycosyltransferase [Blastococcus sp. SYSU DS0552]
MSGPLVSVLVPTYNGERFLRRALESALTQTYRDIEVIVGDDGSVDGTAEILAAVEASDPRVRVVRREQNVGAFDNTAGLVGEARGEYVKYLLHDDLLAPECIETLLAGIRSRPGISMAFSHRAIVDAEEAPIPGRQPALLSDQPGVITGERLGSAVLESCRNVIGEVTTVLFRRADIDLGSLYRLDGRRLQANADVALWLRLLSRGDAYYSPRTLSSFRQHSGQQSARPRLHALGAREWPLLIDWGRRHGFLPTQAEQRRAHTAALTMAASVYAALLDPADSAHALEAVFLSTARLVELDGQVPVAGGRPLWERAHTSAVLDRFARELDVWAQTYPVALAAPELDAAEVDATVQAFREVRTTNAARSLVLAVRPPLVDQAVPLIEAALTRGPDIDVELVPTEDPASLLAEPWLAVAPHGSTWHDGRATAVWTFDPAAGRH